MKNKILFCGLVVSFLAMGAWGQTTVEFDKRSDFFVPPFVTSNQLIATPDGEKVVFKGVNKSFFYWDIKRNKIIKRVNVGEKYKFWQYELLSSTKGNLLVALLHGSKTIVTWSANSGEELNSFSSQRYIDRFTMSKDGNKIATVSDNHISIWSNGIEKRLKKLDSYKPLGISAMILNSDGSRIFKATSDGNISVIDTKLEKELFFLKGETNYSQSLFLSSDDAYLVSKTKNSINVWDIKERKIVDSIHESQEHLSYAIAVSKDANIVLYKVDNTLVVWNRKENIKKKIVSKEGDDPISFTLSIDEKRLFLNSKKGDILTIDLATGKILKRFKGHQSANFHKVLLSSLFPSAKSLWSEVLPHSSRVKDNALPMKIREKIFSLIKENTKYPMVDPRFIKVSLDAKVAIFSIGKRLYIWESGSEEFSKLKEDKENIEGIYLSKDGKTILSSSNYIIKLWDVKTKKQIKILRLENENPSSLILLTPDQKYIFYTVSNRKLMILNTQTEKSIILNASQDKLYVLEYNAKKEQIVTAGKNGLIKVWSTDGQLLKVFVSSQTAIVDVEFTEDGQKLLSIDSNGVGYLWDLNNNRETPLKEFISGQDENWVLFDYSNDKKVLIRHDDGTFLMKKKGKSFEYMGKVE